MTHLQNMPSKLCLNIYVSAMALLSQKGKRIHSTCVAFSIDPALSDWFSCFVENK